MVHQTEQINLKRDEQSIANVTSQKLALCAKIQELRSEVAKLNVELQKSGARGSEIALW